MKKADINFSLTHTLSRLMADRRLKAKDLAKGTGFPPTTISNILRGKAKHPRVNTLKAIAAFFEIEVEELMGVSHGALKNALTSTKSSLRTVKQNISSLTPATIPLIKWQEVKSWVLGEAAVKAHTSWLPNNVCKDPKAFALKLKPSMYSHFFSPRIMRMISTAVILVDLQCSAEDGLMVLAFLDASKEPSLRLLTIDGAEKWLQALEEGVPAVKLTAEHSIIGKVVEIRLNPDFK